MRQYPLVTKLLCVAVVAAVMLPLGNMLFPHLADVLDDLQFSSIEALLSAALGYGLYALMFG
ncbi:MAG: hypothetical protein QOG83_1404 [Alphaproteobacteria bacterium]|jgi:hypothetical protein|nr:hypothetical protein [Alphaproteobacteria bacterium]MEA2988693.1 hypothetical protein [Alphaproteobacteria bacterium]